MTSLVEDSRDTKAFLCFLREGRLEAGLTHWSEGTNSSVTVCAQTSM